MIKLFESTAYVILLSYNASVIKTFNSKIKYKVFLNHLNENKEPPGK